MLDLARARERDRMVDVQIARRGVRAIGTSWMLCAVFYAID
jgi:hypothetical protein